MRIAIDVTLALHDMGGVSTYTRGLLDGLAAIDQENDYLLYSYLEPSRPPAAVLPQRSNFRFQMVEAGPEHWDRVWWEAELPPKEALAPVDVIHSPSFNAPRERHGALVVTVYDASFLACPEFHAEANRLHCLNGTLNAALYADRVIAISEHTKRELCDFLAVPAERIRVTPLAARHAYYPERDAGFIRRTLDRLGIYRNFVLFVGTLEPRKNVNGLLRAYADYATKHAGGEILVVAGGKGWLDEDVSRLASELGIEASVRVVGHVEESDLRVLYSVARVFVYPSFYEGFGLPVVEAMACGAPVVTSGTSALPEAAGDAAVLVDPRDVGELSRAVRSVLGDSDLRREMRRRSLERARRFSWEDTARETLTIYQELSR
jgi:glycosyltransferase involved in cell wall biosynthesis